MKKANILEGFFKSNFKDFKFISFFKIQTIKIKRPVKLVTGKNPASRKDKENIINSVIDDFLFVTIVSQFFTA